MDNELVTLDVSNNPNLITLCCSHNELSVLDVSNNELLTDLDCEENYIFELDVSHNTLLVNLNCCDNELTSLDVSNNTELEELWLERNSLTSIDLSNNVALLRLDCNYNQLVHLDLSNCTCLELVYCDYNPLEYLDIGDNTTLVYWCPRGTIIGPIPSDDEDGVEGFIARLYTEVLGREADSSGIDYWVDELNGGTSGGDAARIFLFSEEFLNNEMNDEEFVGVLYAVFFDRTPDEGGLNYWMGEVTSKGKENVINSLIESQEWANICESYGIATGAGSGSASSDPIVAFAERLYTTCLGRAGEQGGIDFWSAELREGRYGGSDAARGFFFGAEFTNAGHDNTEFVTRLYRTFFNREPDAAGMNFWLGELSNGTSREVAFDTFTGCQEWLNTCSDAGIQP